MTIPKRTNEVIEEQKVATTVAWPDAIHTPRHPGLQLTREFLKNLGENETMTAPADAFPGTDAAGALAAGIKTIRQNPSATNELIKNVHQKIKELPTKKQNPLISPQVNSTNTGEQEGVNKYFDTNSGPLNQSISSPPKEPREPKAPSMTGGQEEDEEAQKSPQFQRNPRKPMQLDITRTHVNAYSPLNPRASSKNDSNRLVNLIKELLVKPKKSTTWE